jgi:protein TonB
MMFDLYARREHISRLAAVLALGVLLSPLLKYRPHVSAKSLEDLISVSMPPEIVEPPPPQPTPAPPLPRPLPAIARQPVLNPIVNAAERSNVVSLADMPQPIPPRVTSEPVAPPPPVIAQPQHNANSEENYIASIRAYLNSIKRYPTGREASFQRPRGKTRVWFMLGRDGRLLEAGIDESSDSLLLDRTALTTVQRGGFPTFPETAWSGQGSHRFTVELEFIPTS